MAFIDNIINPFHTHVKIRLLLFEITIFWIYNLISVPEVKIYLIVSIIKMSLNSNLLIIRLLKKNCLYHLLRGKHSADLYYN